MAWTTADLTSVETAIRAKLTGGAVKRYSIGDRSVESMTIQELTTLRQLIQTELAASDGQRVNLATFVRPN